MSQSSESPNDRINRLELAKVRFAELSFQSYHHHDEALARLETAINNLTIEQQLSTRSINALAEQALL